jgi:hypothetical protein
VQIREGFIVDEDEDEDEDAGEDSDAEARRRIKRKREHRDREQEEALDEDDLDLIDEQFGARPKPQTQVGSTEKPLMLQKSDFAFLVQVQASEAWSP